MPRTGCLGSRTTPSPGPGGRLLRQDRGPSRSTSGGRESGCSTCAPRGGGGVSAIDAAQPDGGQGSDLVLAGSGAAQRIALDRPVVELEQHARPCVGVRPGGGVAGGAV